MSLLTLDLPVSRTAAPWFVLALAAEFNQAPFSTTAVAERLDLDPLQTETWLEELAEQGLLEHCDGEYATGEQMRRFRLRHDRRDLVHLLVRLSWVLPVIGLLALTCFAYREDTNPRQLAVAGPPAAAAVRITPVAGPAVDLPAGGAGGTVYEAPSPALSLMRPAADDRILYYLVASAEQADRMQQQLGEGRSRQTIAVVRSSEEDTLVRQFVAAVNSDAILRGTPGIRIVDLRPAAGSGTFQTLP